ncbi:MAG: CoA-binding protein [Streptosporangiales bacterium]|nr:CoA-binding protein [Streptosporangiales bacterium]
MNVPFTTTERGRLVSPARLREFFAPTSVAVVGASDTSAWSRNIFTSLRTAGFDGRVVPVHPRHETVFDLPAVPGLRDLDDPVDLAFVLVPTHAVEGVVDDAAAAGVRNLIVLAADYAEAGEDGRGRERRLVDQAAASGITLLGPNCLGYLNAHAKAAPYGLVINPPLLTGPVGIVLQSGALAAAVLGFARARAIGISLLASMGNEGMITAPDVLDYLLEDENTKVIALFLEGIRQPQRFAELAGKALEVGKPIVALKVGRSEGGQRAALAHTGAVAGDDAVVDAALRQFGVIRVDSLEELLVTAGLLGYAPRLPAGRRMGVVTASGGACDIIADRADDKGIEIPEFAPSTTAALREVVPPFAGVRNPLDVTGYALADVRARPATPAEDALDVVTKDPGIDFVLCMLTVPEAPPPDSSVRAMQERRISTVAAIVERSPIPVITMGTTCSDVSPYARDLLGSHGLHVVGGIELGMTALGDAVAWAERRERHALRGSPAVVPPPRRSAVVERHGGGPWPEDVAREFVAEAGVPVVSAELVTSATEAALAAKRLGWPVALKVCSAEITHKSDIGGVALGLTSAAQVRREYSRIRRAADAVPDAQVKGVLVSPMRTGGVELLAGVTADPVFGPIVAVGLGGIFVEVLRDTRLRLLPVDEAEVRRMLGELRGAPLLRGARGGRPVDLDKVARVVVRLAASAQALGEELEAVEVNPLWADGDRVEALDVLVVTKKRGS